jgi:hypothetical protein
MTKLKRLTVYDYKMQSKKSNTPMMLLMFSVGKFQQLLRIFKIS